jgi:hypothetical protein
MVYVELPLHPDSDECGLWEIQSIVSPRYSDRCPRDGMLIRGVICRGYREFFRRACKVRLPTGRMAFDVEVVRKKLPDALKVTKGDMKRLREKHDRERMTDEARIAQKVNWRAFDNVDVEELIDAPAYRAEKAKELKRLWKPGDPDPLVGSLRAFA